MNEAKKTVDFALFSLKHLKVVWAALINKTDEDDNFLERYDKYTRLQQAGNSF